MHLCSSLLFTTLVLTGHSFAGVLPRQVKPPWFFNTGSIAKKPWTIRGMEEIEKAVTNVTNVYPYDCRCNNQYANDDIERCSPLEKISHIKLANCYTMRTGSVSLRVWDTRLGVSQYVECRAYWHGGCHGVATAPLVFEENFQCRDMVERYNHHGKFKSLMCVNLVREQPWPEDAK
ncbi:hypothetical protein GGI43DRAFT_2044 [Trichoderma evansii]